MRAFDNTFLIFITYSDGKTETTCPFCGMDLINIGYEHWEDEHGYIPSYDVFRRRVIR